jgi:hypothetical protein
MDRLAETNHNGNFFTVMERLMNNDRASFNLAWARRIDWALEVAGDRGIYIFLNIFNTWGRTAHTPYDWTTRGADQLLNPWNPSSHSAATELLLRYLVARYAGYYNVLWDLGNEMELFNDGSAFTHAANTVYVPTLRRHDPYDLPITLSENIWKNTNVDIGGYHHMQRDPTSTRPTMLTELVGGSASLWKNSHYADPARRSAYRHPVWVHFVTGGSGSIEASNLFDSDIAFPTLTDFLKNHNIRTVMEDHGRLALFLREVETPLYELTPGRQIGSSNAGYLAIGKPGQEYVAYWAAPGRSPTVQLSLPAGNYDAYWYHPTTGERSAVAVVTSGTFINAPALRSNDVVLHLRRR